MTVSSKSFYAQDKYQKLRNASIQVLRKIGVDTGGSNVQFAISPHDGRILVIEVGSIASGFSFMIIFYKNNAVF